MYNSSSLSFSLFFFYSKREKFIALFTYNRITMSMQICRIESRQLSGIKEEKKIISIVNNDSIND